ncbi:MAG TPA: hypothetical protein VKX25_05470 [Bryobacteraceae bacterium]|jgi:hypothetical protein|nr:hypothetical protein [Bryobacteraceae bacterium]
MLLGALLIAVAVFLRRWLSAGPDATRHGFTAKRIAAKRIAAKKESWINALGNASALLAPGALNQSIHPQQRDFHFDGGDAGGGGAASTF